MEAGFDPGPDPDPDPDVDPGSPLPNTEVEDIEIIPPQAPVAPPAPIKKRLDNSFSVQEWRTICARLFGLTVEEAESSGVIRRLRNRSCRSNDIFVALGDVCDIDADDEWTPTTFLDVKELDSSATALASTIQDHLGQPPDEPATLLEWVPFTNNNEPWGTYKHLVDANEAAGLCTGIRIFVATKLKSTISAVTNFVRFPPHADRDPQTPWIVVLRASDGTEKIGSVTGATIRKHLQSKKPDRSKVAKEEIKLEAAGDSTTYSAHDADVPTVTRITSWLQLRELQKQLHGHSSTDFPSIGRRLGQQAACMSMLVPIASATTELRLLALLERIDVHCLQDVHVLKSVDNALQSTS